MIVTNTLAYCVTELITAVKRFLMKPLKSYICFQNKLECLALDKLFKGRQPLYGIGAPANLSLVSYLRGSYWIWSNIHNTLFS